MDNTCKCAVCDAEDVKLTLIDEAYSVCDDCLNTKFFYCEQCHEYCRLYAVESFVLSDGRAICEYCAEELDGDLILYADDDEEERRFKQLLFTRANDPKYNKRVYETRGIYFTLCNGIIVTISDDAGYDPKGSWFPPIVTAPTEEEERCLSSMMQKLDFDEGFFYDMIEEIWEFSDEGALEYFEDMEDEESAAIYRKMKKQVEGGKTPFETMDDFVSALGRYGLERGHLYYLWESEYIELYENICDTGLPRGNFEDFSTEDWIKILENLDNYETTA